METLLKWFEAFSVESLDQMDQYYTDDCYFRDPFNEVYTREELKALFHEMLKLKDFRFTVLESIKQDDKAFLTWDFHFKILGKAQSIHGGSLLHFAEDGPRKNPPRLLGRRRRTV